ncbi:Hin recombinase [Clostridium butyricum]|uniref:Hin recombinase n=1 Tax=Clostridium butyricum TaxID=1492 RepID=UPI003466F162
MAKLTQKQLIEQQQKEIEDLKNMINDKDTLIQKLNNEITKMIDNADNSFKNSSDYMQMQKRINILELKNKSLSDTVQHNLKIHNLKHNERGAGRKNRFTDEHIIEIKQYRADGKTIKQIAEIFNCSVGLIHKLINE